LSEAKFSSWPYFTEEECRAVRDVLLSNKVNYWTGDICREFEKEYAAWTEVKYAVALSNGTAALEASLKALGIGEGDEVVVSPRTFISSVSSIINVSAKPVFADVDINSGNITAESVEKCITKQTKAIICVHLAGWPCDMDSILELARSHDLSVIEDCAQAHGAKYKNRPVGSIGDIGCWSFCQDKIISTGGEGGMITTNSYDMWSKIWSLKDHGKSWHAVYSRERKPGYQWVHESFGANMRMTEMQAAIGRIHLNKITEWHLARKNNATAIFDVCDNYPDLLRAPKPPEYIEHAWYKCHVYLRTEVLSSGWTRDKIIEQINAQGVPCYHGSCSEVYLEKAFDQTGLRPAKRLPNAKQLGETSLLFLVHPTLTESEIQQTCDVLSTVMAAVRD
jgi:dTDP-4-amino-4,6-dideoxygalactose transaminase